jgi:hypothetical protein
LQVAILLHTTSAKRPQKDSIVPCEDSALSPEQAPSPGTSSIHQDLLIVILLEAFHHRPAAETEQRISRFGSS